MKRRFLLAMVFVGSLVLTVWVNPSMAAPAGPIELRAISAWPVQVGQNYWFHDFVKEVNERAKKAGIPLTIKKLGGPEVIGQTQQFAAVRSGAIDMVYTAGSFASEAPELEAQSLIRPDPIFYLNALRETKVLDVFRAVGREKLGAIPLFPCLAGYRYTLLSKKLIKPSDWSGLKIRSSGTMSASGISAMGGAPVLVPASEVFDAFQRGIIDAVFGSPGDRYSFGERGVYKYIIMPGFAGGNVSWFISSKVWDDLPGNMRTFLESVLDDMLAQGLLESHKWNDEALIKYMNEDKLKPMWCTPAEQQKLDKAFRMDLLETIAKRSPNYGQRIYNLIKDYVY